MWRLLPSARDRQDECNVGVAAGVVGTFTDVCDKNGIFPVSEWVIQGSRSRSCCVLKGIGDKKSECDIKRFAV